MNPINESGDKKWYNKVKQLHRTDGLAIERSNGWWYLNGRRHRTDGPAVVLASGSKGWYLNGKLHRTDGPAIEYFNGTKKWYLNDKELSKEFFNVLTRCPLEDLPLMLNKGFDNYIAERLKNES